MALEGGEGSAPRPGRTLPPGKIQYPLYRRLGGPQGRSGQVQKISPPTRIRSPDRPAHSQSLYRLSYRAHTRYVVCNKYQVLNTRHWIFRLTLIAFFLMIILLEPFKCRVKSHLLALLGAHHILHVSRIRVNTKHWIFRLTLTAFCLMIILLEPFKRRVKSHLLALLGAHLILHVSRIRVKKFLGPKLEAVEACSINHH